jgi:hypothetical protein
LQDVYAHNGVVHVHRIFHQIFSKWQVVELSHFVRPSGYIYMVCPAISSYRIFHQIFSKWQVVELSHFVRPFGYIYMVCPAISSYSFGATALIICRMYVHIMEVWMYTGFWWSHFILKKSLTKQLSIIIKCGGILLF